MLPPFTRTVRFKLTLWYSGLLLVFGVAFVVALNLAVRFDRPVLEVKDARYELVREGPGQALALRPILTLQEAEDTLFAENLQKLRFWSLLSVVGLAMASGVGGYLLSGMLLRPVRDITEAAAEVGASNLGRRINHQGPDDELKTLADTFDSMIERLEHSFAQQRLFVQDASHELRTPLAAIRTNIEVLEMDPEASPEEYRELLDTVKAQTERLTRLSDDLLLLTTSEGETPEMEPVATGMVVREVLSQLEPLASQRGVSLVQEGDVHAEAMASADLLYRCVQNLVENAIKYAGEETHIRVQTRRTGAYTEVIVADDGVGVPPEALPHLFDRFYRVDRGRSRREGGTGLGLSIVRELVSCMGGTVKVASELGEGTTFTIQLAAPETQDASTNPRGVHGTKTAEAIG
ncbi:MAG: sensor histidine kinase [Dehalococcoidia bacterium]